MEEWDPAIYDFVLKRHSAELTVLWTDSSSNVPSWDFFYGSNNGEYGL
jgi:hypothetical protein